MNAMHLAIAELAYSELLGMKPHARLTPFGLAEKIARLLAGHGMVITSTINEPRTVRILDDVGTDKVSDAMAGELPWSL